MFFHDSGYNCAIWSAILLAKKQSPVNQWIPCKDKMPPKPLIGEDGYIVQEHNVEEPYSAYWNGEKWTDDEDNEIEGIIAWQPLPEAYKEINYENKKIQMHG